ncbi:MAG: flagellar hook-associated protein FlgK, partial [Bdellovibrionales bacterium]
MSLSGALSVALSGLKTCTTAVQISAGNISNAQTEGYTQKSLSLSSVAGGASTGGVEVTGYTRLTNSVLITTLNNATSTASYYSTQNSYLSQVQTILDSTSSPPALSEDLNEFQSAWTLYAASPSDATLEKNIVSSGQALANTISNIASQISILETSVKSDLSTAVTELNTSLKRVQELNIQIASALANNQSTANLEDQRDQEINSIAAKTNVTVMARSNGQVALYTSNGTALLDGVAQTFSVGGNGNSVLNAAGSDVSSSLTGGILQAQTDFLSSTATSADGVGVIVKLESQLQNFANMFVATTTDGNSFADVYNAAITDTGEQSASFFTADIDATNGLPDLSTFAVNSDLVNGTTSVKKAAGTVINDAFSSSSIAITTTDMGGGVYTYTTSNT